jgi:hypothetical protein
MFKNKMNHVTGSKHVGTLKINVEIGWTKIHKDTALFSHTWTLANLSEMNVRDRCNFFIKQA